MSDQAVDALDLDELEADAKEWGSAQVFSGDQVLALVTALRAAQQWHIDHANDVLIPIEKYERLQARIAELTHMIGAADTGLAERLSAALDRIAELETQTSSAS